MSDLVQETKKKRRSKQAPPKTSTDRVTWYALEVTRGNIVAGPIVRAACERHLRDLETAIARGWYWSAPHRDRVIRFFEQALRLNGGAFEGLPFFLSPWQAFVIGSIFGWIDQYGKRRFQTAYIEAAKGSGKSPLAAGIGLFMLKPDGEARAEVYAAASKKDQSMVLFRDAVAMVNLSPRINATVVKTGGLNTSHLAHVPTGSFFRAIASDEAQSGPRPHCALVDEVHEHPNDTVVEMMRAGFKGRTQPLLFMITNSGFDRNTVCWMHHDYGSNVAQGVRDDDRYFAYICALDKDDDPFDDESCWPKANPNLGVSITSDYLRGQVREARGMPSKASKVRRLNFCMWVDAENPWIERHLWEAVCSDFNPEKELAGEEAIGGLDLSGTRDMTALALYFPEKKMAFVEFWTPEETLDERAERDKIDSYRSWVEAGYLRTTPGRSVNYSFVVQRIAELQMHFNIKTIAFDPYRIKYMETTLTEEGVEVSLTSHPQGFYRAADSKLWMPRSIELLEDAIARKDIKIQTNPVLNMNSAAAVPERDAKENRIFTKRKSTGRIDGLVALAMAMGASEGGKAPEPEYQMMFV